MKSKTLLIVSLSLLLIPLQSWARLGSESGVELLELTETEDDPTVMASVPNTFVVQNKLQEPIFVSCSSTRLSPRAVPKIEAGNTTHVDIPGIEQGYAICKASKCSDAGSIIFKTVLQR